MVTTPTAPADMTVAVYDGAYRPKGQLADFISCSVTWQWLGVGTGQLVVTETDPAAPLLLSVAESPLMIVVTAGGQRWSGRVATTTFNRQGAKGSGTITAALVDEWIWLKALLASQNGANPALTGMPQYDSQTGPTATVAAHYINAAAQRLTVPVIALAPVGDQSQQVTLQARMTLLADLLTTPLQSAGMSMPATIWLPGDLKPPGFAYLDRPTIIFTPAQTVPKPYLRWSDSAGDIGGVNLVANEGTAYRATLGLDGQGAARNYDSFTDTALAQQLGDYALPEMYADESSTTLAGGGSQAKARADLVPARPTVSAAFSVSDGDPWRFGSQYVAGDVGQFEVLGVQIADRITSVTASLDRTNGLTFTPVVGLSSPTATSDELMVHAIASIAQQLRQIQTRS
jgi:hypothetical protein